MRRVLFATAALLGLAACATTPAAPPVAAAPVATAPQAAAINLRDLQGLWVISNRSLRGFRDENLQPLKDVLTPAAAKTKAEADVALDPSARCLSMFPRMMGWPYPLAIAQTPKVTLVLFEAEQIFRQIHTDGRGHPDAEDQRWMGHSIGKWEGDTLVVDTTNLNPNAWLEADGTPTTEKTHITEWFNLTEGGKTLEVKMKIDDPAIFTQPVYKKFVYNLRNDWDIKEYFCAEGNRDNVFDTSHGQLGSLKVTTKPAAKTPAKPAAKAPAKK